MSELGDFQSNVRKLIGPSTNFAIDRPHGGKPAHVDLTSRFPHGADKVEVDFSGNIIGRSTSVDSIKIMTDPCLG